jgi:hypothetical protein
MSDAPHIIYTQRADTTAETELNTLTRIYRLVLFESNARKNAAEQASSPNKPDGHDEAKEWKHGCSTAVAYLWAVERVLERLYG